VTVAFLRRVQIFFLTYLLTCLLTYLLTGNTFYLQCDLFLKFLLHFCS